MTDIIPWIATAATIIAATMTAASLGPRVTGYGFVVFTIGALCWIAVGILKNEPALLWTSVALTALDLFGIWRWLGVQAKVDEGARFAAQASEKTPGEALFPISLLSRAPVECDGVTAGNCVDAMAGCRSGQLDYVVVAQGGIGGVGETLRKLPWSKAEIDGERLITRLDCNRFDQLEELTKDRWPAR